MISADGCYDLDGSPLTTEQWMAYKIGLQDDPSRWRIGREDFDEFTVSTVWTGIDVTNFGERPPRIWETAIFSHGSVETIMRWESREDAQAGHEVFLKVMRDPRTRQRYRETVREFTVD